MGVRIRNELISILAFADDIVILTNTEEELQKMLKCIENWCKKWRLKVNIGKTIEVHFRNKRKKKTNFNFKFDGVSLDIVEKYKYLGNIVNQHLDFKVISTVLAGATGRALGSVISKFKARILVITHFSRSIIHILYLLWTMDQVFGDMTIQNSI